MRAFTVRVEGDEVEDRALLVPGARAALMKLQDRERRLVHLFSLGEVDEGIIREQLRGVRAEIATLERERRRHAAPAETVRLDVVGLEAACRHVLNRLAGDARDDPRSASRERSRG